MKEPIEIKIKNINFHNCILGVLFKASVEITIHNGECVFIPENSVFFCKKNTLMDVTLNNNSNGVPYYLYHIDNNTALSLGTILRAGLTLNEELLPSTEKPKDSIFIRHVTIMDLLIFSRLKKHDANISMYNNHLLLHDIAYILSRFSKIDKIIPILLHSHKKNTTEQVKEIVEKDLQYKWTLSKISNQLHMSEINLRKRLASEGVNFNQFLTSIRMMHAAHQFTISDHSINQVSIMIGYSSVSYFIKKFDDYFGITPKQYCLKIRANNLTDE